MTYAILKPRGRSGRALLAVFAGLLAVGAARAETYVFDKDHTQVRFSWNHLGLSRQSGQFFDVSGTVDFDPAEPEAAYANITIPIAGISTGVRALDDALTKTRDFFDAEQFPVAEFKSTEVKRTGGKTALMKGDLSINGVTRPVTLEVNLNFTGEHPMAQINPAYAGVVVAGFSAATQIRRSDWGIVRTIPYVSDEIQITIEAETRHKEAPGIGAGAPPISDPAPDRAGSELDRSAEREREPDSAIPEIAPLR